MNPLVAISAKHGEAGSAIQGRWKIKAMTRAAYARVHAATPRFDSVQQPTVGPRKE